MWKPILFLSYIAEDQGRLFNHRFPRKTEKLMQSLHFLGEVQREQNLNANFTTTPGQVDPDLERFSLLNHEHLWGEDLWQLPRTNKVMRFKPGNNSDFLWLLCWLKGMLGSKDSPLRVLQLGLFLSLVQSLAVHTLKNDTIQAQIPAPYLQFQHSRNWGRRLVSQPGLHTHWDLVWKEKEKNRKFDQVWLKSRGKPEGVIDKEAVRR